MFHQYHPFLSGYRISIRWVPQTMKFPLGSFLHLSVICFLPPSAVASQTASPSSASLSARGQVPHPYKTYNFVFQIQFFKFEKPERPNILNQILRRIPKN